MRAAIIGLLTLATPAAAQNSQTICRNSFGTMICDTATKPSGGSAYWEAYEARRRAGQADADAIDSFLTRRSEAAASKEAQAAERRDQLQRQTVGGLVADGRCAEARRYSLEIGRFDLAKDVDTVCKP